MWQRESEFWIQHRKTRAQQEWAAQGNLLASGNVGYHGVARSLAPRSRNGEHHSHGHGFFCLGFSGIEIPEVAVVRHAERDGFGGVDGTAAANGKEKVIFLATHHCDTFAHQTIFGIRLDAAQFAKAESGFGERFFNTGEKAASDNRTLSVNDQHFFAPYRSAKSPVCCSVSFPNTKWVGLQNSKLSIRLFF